MNDTVAVFNRYAAEYDHWFEEIAAAFEELAASLRRVIPRAGSCVTHDSGLKRK